jgi:hypothetical protein
VVATLTGQVFDPRGRPLHRAQVWILRPRPLRLSITGEDGRFELPLHRRGRHLLEAEWFTDLRSERLVVDVPETGDPPAIAFHLKPAGVIYGELTAGGEPVSYAEVDVYDGDKWILDTEADNGLFVFEEEPPVGKPLELRVKAAEGYPNQPVRFTWPGTPLDLGTIELQRFPSCAVRVVLPDGEGPAWLQARGYPDGPPAGDEDPYDRRTLLPAGGCDILEQEGVLRISPPGPRVLETWIAAGVPGDARPPYLIRAPLTFDEAPRAPVELSLRPGPFRVRGRIVDDRGRPVAARFVLRSAPDTVLRTEADGRFDIEVPHGGVHQLRFTGLELPEIGRALLGREVWPVLGSCWCDADRPGEPCRFQATGRVLFLAERAGTLRIGPASTRARWLGLWPMEDGSFAALSSPVRADEQTWSYFGWYGEGMIEDAPLEQNARGLTIVRIGG